MIAPPDGYCDRTLILLLRTFLDVIALKKGPEHIPSSWLLLVLAGAFLLISSFGAARLLAQSLGLSLAVDGLGFGLYVLVMLVAGHSRRVLPTLTTIIGCGAILTVIFAAELVLFEPVLGEEAALTIGLLIHFWSVFVEGHIMSRALGRHLFAGVAIAIAAFTLRYAFQLHVTRG
jgi:hypothetical protein